MDCFYAQVEMRDNPALRHVPVGIGGPSKTRGVLCTSNYEARKYGVRAAQPTFQAFRLCPDLVLIPPDFKKYRAVAEEIKAIFLTFSDQVQSVSLDEAYLDVTRAEAFGGSATKIAEAIKAEILSRTGLTASAGVSFNKMLAKIASDWQKPDGLTVITPDMREAFMKDLPLEKISGIGKISVEKYRKEGFGTCGDVTALGADALIARLGKEQALDLYRRCQGISNARVKTEQKRKSFGIERTYFNGISSLEAIEEETRLLAEKFNQRFLHIAPVHTENRMISHLFYKIKGQDFSVNTKDVALDALTAQRLMRDKSLREEDIKSAIAILHGMQIACNRSLRLLGLGIRLKDRHENQLSFGFT